MDKRLTQIEDAGFYSTGDVHEPKDRRNMIAGIVLASICLLCILTLLVFVSKYLFSDFWGAEDQQAAMLFIKDMEFSAQQNDAEGYADIDRLGIHGRVLTAFDQQYFDLPSGVYITTNSTLVPELMVGDVLLSVNGTAITDPEALNATIYEYDSEDPLSLEIYRGGETLIVTTNLMK